MAEESGADAPGALNRTPQITRKGLTIASEHDCGDKDVVRLRLGSPSLGFQGSPALPARLDLAHIDMSPSRRGAKRSPVVRPAMLC